MMPFERRPLLGLDSLHDGCDLCWGTGCGVQMTEDLINEVVGQRYE